MPYVTEGGFGSFSRDPTKIADTISRWLRDDKLLAEMSSKAKEASRPLVCIIYTTAVHLYCSIIAVLVVVIAGRTRFFLFLSWCLDSVLGGADLDQN